MQQYSEFCEFIMPMSNFSPEMYIPWIIVHVGALLCNFPSDNCITCTGSRPPCLHYVWKEIDRCTHVRVTWVCSLYTYLPSIKFIFFGSNILMVCWRMGSLDFVTPEGLQFTNSSVWKTHSINFSAAISGLLASLALASLSWSQTMSYKRKKHTEGAHSQIKDNT